MNKDKVIVNCEEKMYIRLDLQEKNDVNDALENYDIVFKKINSDFPELGNLEMMTHTIEVDDIILNEDVPASTPEVEILFRNSERLNAREIEVPKVVG